jgi:hypothetical protein
MQIIRILITYLVIISFTGCANNSSINNDLLSHLEQTFSFEWERAKNVQRDILFMKCQNYYQERQGDGSLILRRVFTVSYDEKRYLIAECDFSDSFDLYLYFVVDENMNVLGYFKKFAA